MCVNAAVRSLPSQAAINERCLELGKNKSSKPTRLDEDANAVKKAKTAGKHGALEEFVSKVTVPVQDCREPHFHNTVSLNLELVIGLVPHE